MHSSLVPHMAYNIRCVATAVLFSVALAATPSAFAETNQPKPDLTGVVQTKDGQPITGASIFIYTAGPRVGVGYL